MDNQRMGNQTDDISPHLVPLRQAETGNRQSKASESGVTAEDRRVREAAELRRNLQRRKAQQRSRRDLSD